MTLTDLVLKWNNQWRYDYWWRRKYNVAFNSEAHRNVSQIDIKFEFIESTLANKQMEKSKEREERLKEFKETGKWIRESIDKNREDELFSKMDLSNF